MKISILQTKKKVSFYKQWLICIMGLLLLHLIYVIPKLKFYKLTLVIFYVAWSISLNIRFKKKNQKKKPKMFNNYGNDQDLKKFILEEITETDKYKETVRW